MKNLIPGVGHVVRQTGVKFWFYSPLTCHPLLKKKSVFIMGSALHFVKHFCFPLLEKYCTGQT